MPVAIKNPVGEKMANQEKMIEEYISELIARARKAQKLAENLTQEEVDEIATAITWEFVHNKKLVEELAIFSFNEWMNAISCSFSIGESLSESVESV